MTVNATALVSKINFVLSTRVLAQGNYIDEYPELPQTGAQEEDIVKDLVFAYIKKRFPGCRIRQNQHTYSLRLDSHIHRKANKLRDIYQNEPEWKQWLESNHSRLHRTMRDNRQGFQSGNIVRTETRNDNTFLYIPFKSNRIYNFMQSGLMDFMRWIDNEYTKDERLAAIYEDVTRLIEEEVQRRERERLERIEREFNEYRQRLISRLHKPAAELQESQDPLDRLFAQKVIEWARANGKAPEYVIEAGPQEMVPTGLKVKVMAPQGSEEEGWIALPPFDGYQDPANYELQGWGKVTSIDMTSDRSRNGQAPIVIQDYIYAEFNMEYWKHLLPEGYAEMLEVAQQLRREAEAEIEPFLEQERIRKEREAEEERQRQEAERIRLEEERRIREEQIRREMEELRRREEAEAARREAERARRVEEERRAREVHEAEIRRMEEEAAANAERRHALAEQLRQQITQPVVIPDGVAHVVLDEAQPVEAAEPIPEPERATTAGVYRNGMAIPLERYVGIREDGTARRFRQIYDAIQFAGLSDEQEVNIRDYHEPHSLVDIWYNESYIEEDYDDED